jgi:hypothetical protein
MFGLNVNYNWGAVSINPALVVIPVPVASVFLFDDESDFLFNDGSDFNFTRN